MYKRQVTLVGVVVEVADCLFGVLVQLNVEGNVLVQRIGLDVYKRQVFNHCGSFNKWLDRERIYEKQGGYEPGAYISADSPYRTFFKFDRSAWPYNDHYDGWWGHNTLPKLNYEESPKLYDYIMRIARKWVSAPYCVDGWRLDVAADLGLSLIHISGSAVHFC